MLQGILEHTIPVLERPREDRPQFWMTAEVTHWVQRKGPDRLYTVCQSQGLHRTASKARRGAQFKVNETCDVTSHPTVNFTMSY
jgi:hypothetical protein